VLAALLAGCGISYGDGDKGTELFESLTVGGDLVTGGQVTIELAYTQPYAVNISVACVLIAKGGQDEAPSTTAAPTAAPALTPEEPNATATVIAIPGPVPTPRHKVLDILQEQIQAKPDETPIEYSTPVPGTIDGAFTAPEAPGAYEVRCYTPADLNNAIRKRITIASR